MSRENGEKKKRVVQKYDMDTVEDLWGSGLSDENADLDDDAELDALLYGDIPSDASAEQVDDYYGTDDQLVDDVQLYADGCLETPLEGGYEPDTVAGQDAEEVGIPEEQFSDDAPEAEEIFEESAEVSPGAAEVSGALHFVGGSLQEISRIRLFQPDENTLLLIDEETGDEAIVFFEQLVCLEISGFPAGIARQRKETCAQEIIETVDGKTFTVLVGSRQELSGLLFCFATEGNPRFPVIVFPRASIRKRRQDKRLIDILAEKRFISRTILQRALQEFELLKGMTFEKIIAQKARIPLSDIAEALDNARQNQMHGMQTGEILLISGLVDEEQILAALDYHEHIKHLDMGQFLVEKGMVKEVELYCCLAEKHRIPFVDLRNRNIPRESLALLPQSMIVQHEILPLVRKDAMLLIATHSVDPTPFHDAVINASGCQQVKYVLSPPGQIRTVIQATFGTR
ncbi:MAG: GspE/PulE/PilB domain-containing protein [Desulfobulbaceae bacterium]